MKIRIQNNTVRIRLNDREVQDLHQGKEIVSKTRFPGNELTISLCTGHAGTAEFIANRIDVTVSQSEVDDWATSQEVTMAMTYDLPNDEKLSILVEKDMKV